MKITSTSILKLCVEDVEGIQDGLFVILESTGPKRGLATVRYGQQSWSSFWPAMPHEDVVDFFATAPCDYLVDNMTAIMSHTSDSKGFKNKTLLELLKLRRRGEITKENAKDLHSTFSQAERAQDVNGSMLAAVWGGDDWWHCIGSVPNPAYEKATHVMAAAQRAVRQYRDEQKAKTE